MSTEEIIAEFWDCTRDEYDNDKGWKRSSELKDFWACPFLYHARHIAGTMPAKKQTDEMFLGQCVHSLVLEGEQTWRVAGRCGAVLGSGDNKGEIRGARASELFDTEEGIWVCKKHLSKRKVEVVKDAMDPADHDRVQRMADAVLRYPEIRECLKSRIHETAGRSVCPETGIKKKALLDIIQLSPYVIRDLKTLSVWNSEAIWRQFDSHGWGLSMAHYESVLRDIAKHGKGIDLPPAQWEFIVLESEHPHRCQLWPEGGVPTDVQDKMRQTHLEIMRDMKACQDAGEWKERPLEPGVPQWFWYRHGFQRETAQ